MLPESRDLQQATNTMEAAQARYDALSAGPNADLVAAGRARVAQAQSALDQQLSPATPSRIAEVEAQVRNAQAALDLLRAGARSEELAAAAITVTEAEATLQRAEADLANTSLRTPLTGTVPALGVNAGEMVNAGDVVAPVADLGHLRVETTDLSERDVARVAAGQPATVFVEPLNADVPGRVTQIAPAATVIGGDVVYMVVVELDEQPSGLRWGMTAQVEIPEN
jgi:multidrug resistance efflux pump